MANKFWVLNLLAAKLELIIILKVKQTYLLVQSTNVVAPPGRMTKTSQNYHAPISNPKHPGILSILCLGATGLPGGGC